MVSPARDRRLVVLEQAQAREERLRVSLEKERRIEAVRAVAGFARALVLAATPAPVRPVAAPVAPMPSPGVPPTPVPSVPMQSADGFYPRYAGESEEAHLDRLRPLLKGYQLDSLTAGKLLDRYPALAIEKGR